MTRRPMCLVCLLLMAAMCLLDWLGFPLIRGNPLPDQLQTWVEQHPESTICGEVERCTETEFSQSVYLKQTYLIYNSNKISIENVRVFLNEKEEIPAGTVLLLSGKLERVEEPRNPGEFDSQQYYACQHIYYFMKNATIVKKSRNYSAYGQWVLDMRAKFAHVLEETAEEAAPVFCAIVLGDKSNLETEVKMRYQLAGIVHILAISGLHISLLGMGLYQLFMKTGMGIWPSGMLSLVIMLQYGIMTGGSVSTMRAVCMFLISVGAKILGRIYDMMTALSVTAILILVDTPAYLYNSGFLLSFGAVIGIGVAAPILCEITGAEGKLSKSLVSSLAVQLTTLPISLWSYGEVSVAGVFLNLIVLPTVGVVLLSGVGAALAGCISIPIGWLAALPGRGLLWGYEKLCELVGNVSFCTWIGGQPKWWQAAVYYLVFISILVSGKYLTEKRKKIIDILLLGGAIFLLGYHSSSNLKITCLDVGQGDGISVETPDGYHFLIDGGSSNKSAVGQYQILPYLKSQGISCLDGIFISHTDNDHISGIKELLTFISENLTTIRVKALYLPGWSSPPQEWQELVSLAKKAGSKVIAVNAGDSLKAGKTVFSVLSPGKDATGQEVNEEAMVLKLEYGSFRALFTGDIGEETEEKLLKQGVLTDVDFLKVGHHGSRYSSCSAFLETIQPETGVISCSSTNTYGHPSPEAIERLEAAGCHLEYTMKNGAITILTDGEKVKVTSFLNG